MMPLIAQQRPQTSSTSATTQRSPSGVADRRIAMSYHDHHHYPGKAPLPNIPQTIKSQSIPISSGMHRTASELQLCEDEALADYRDFVVYSRIVNGISRQQETSRSMYLRHENEKCLAHLTAVRNGASTVDPSLQTMSPYIVQGMARAAADDYFCGEDPQEYTQQHDSDTVNELLTEDDDDIFNLEL